MNIRFANPGDEAAWDAYVMDSPASSPYHLFAWRKAVEEAYGHRPFYLMAEKGGEIKGVLPLIYLKPPFLAGELVSLPFCDTGDVIAEDEPVKEALLLESLSLVRDLGARYVELRGMLGGTLLEEPGFVVTTRSHKVKMVLEIPGSSEKLWNGFKSKLRSQVRKTEKNGLRFEWGGPGDLDIFYAVFSRNLRDLGSPVHSRKWFLSVMEHYRDRIRMGLVYHKKELTGAGLIICMNRTVSIPWASTAREFNRLAPNMMLYWNFLEFAADNGFTQFDFGRSSPDEGTYRFKAQWGAGPVPLYWHYFVPGNKAPDFDTGGSSKKEKLVSLWQELPLALANTVGPVIRKYISL